jgi:hypothetical protein
VTENQRTVVVARAIKEPGNNPEAIDPRDA